MPETFSIRMMGSDISLQRHTSEVPRDGRYHLLQGTTILKSFTRKNDAMRSLNELLQETGYQPPKREDESVDPAEILREEAEERGRFASEVYWAGSHRHGSGGKLSNR